MLEDLVNKFQSASESLERSYRELQDRVQALTEELEEEREHRIQLERLAAMGEMAMELAHEIRNPLGSIELYASMMEGQYAEQIVRSVRLLNHSVTNVLQFGRPIVPVMERISINRLLEGVQALLQPIAQQKQIHIDVECESDSYAVADHELLHRMLLNLVLNALRETSMDGQVRLQGRVAGRDILLVVEDTGPGLPAMKAARIFDPMFSTSRDGCGLGLAIVKRIVESHHGKITVESSNTGTRFVIAMPDNEARATRPDAFLEGRPSRHTGSSRPGETGVNNMEVVSEPPVSRRRRHPDAFRPRSHVTA